MFAMGQERVVSFFKHKRGVFHKFKSREEIFK